MKITLSLKFDDSVWIAEGEGLKVIAKTLEDLDSAIEKVLRRRGYRGKIEVFMKFNYSTIPQWIRQFHPHYFNRSIVLQID